MIAQVRSLPSCRGEAQGRLDGRRTRARLSPHPAEWELERFRRAL